ncbi:MAG TPA: T9SS type A sorting domain-containing protein [Saprospiraceae bacterium]|nr:T9SS type A sorting domain-containing protein [Saprospiraceae bacterium]HMQ83402.1 T9SS type A sorting domain-containing protein [Saprospiraceae bacterium]
MRIYAHILMPLIFAFPSMLFCQTFPQNNATWQGVVYGIAGPIPYEQYLCGDTLINGQHYGAFYEQYLNFPNDTVRVYRGAIRVNGPRVWAIPANTEEEILLYDFSLQVGDELTLPYFDDPSTFFLKVANVYTVQQQGISRKVIQFVPQMGIEESWVEGVGSIRGPIYRGVFFADFLPELHCFKEDNVLRYRNIMDAACDFEYNCDVVSATDPLPIGEIAQAFPNVTQGEFTLNILHQGHYRLLVFDANGRLLKQFDQLQPGQHILSLAELPSGIYGLNLIETNNPLYLQHFKIILTRTGQ